MGAERRRRRSEASPVRWWLVIGFGTVVLLAVLSLDALRAAPDARGGVVLVWGARVFVLVVFVALLSHVKRQHDQLGADQRRHLAEAEERARRQAGERGEKLEAILAVAPMVGRTPEPRLLLSSMLERACAAVEATAGALVLLSEDRRRLNKEAVVGPLANGRDDGEAGSPFAWWVTANGVALRLADATRDPRFGSMTPAGRQTVACVPLLVRGRPVGALEVVNKRDGACFTADDEALLSAFASLSALAIENAVLFAETTDLARRAVALAGPAEWPPAHGRSRPAPLRLV
jgi:hypothetical protein